MTTTSQVLSEPLIQVVEPEQSAPQQFAARVALTLATVIAAGTFLVAKDTTTRFAFLELGYLRITLSFLVILPTYLLLHRSKPLPKKEDLPRLIILGLAGVTCNQLLFLYGINYAPALDGALFYAFTPALVLIGAVTWLNERLSKLKLWGIGLAITGVALILQARGLNFSAAYLRGDLFLMMAVVAWALYTLLGKSLLKKYDPFTLIVWGFGFGALSMAPFSHHILGNLDWAKPGVSGWLGLVYLSVLTSAVAFTLWQWALKHLEASQVAVFTNLQPAMTALLAWLFLGDIPGGMVIVGGLLIMSGVAMTQHKKAA